MTQALVALACLSLSYTAGGRRVDFRGGRPLLATGTDRSNDTSLVDINTENFGGDPNNGFHTPGHTNGNWQSGWGTPGKNPGTGTDMGAGAHGNRPVVILWQELVPPPGQTWMFMSRENVKLVETNSYQWWSKTNDIGQWQTIPFANLEGSWTSNQFGHQTVHVRDLEGRERFMIRNSKNVWNPFSMRSSFRVHPPGNKEVSWFTFNKDVIGRGFMGMKEEWRIFYGKERNSIMLYYCVGSYTGWSYNCYTKKEDYDQGATPIAYTEQEVNAGAIMSDFSQWLPDNYRLYIRSGVDSALILALMTVIDICNDAKHQENNLLELGANSTSRMSDAILMDPHHE